MSILMGILGLVFNEPKTENCSNIPPRNGYPERLNLTHPSLLDPTKLSTKTTRTDPDTADLIRFLRERYSDRKMQERFVRAAGFSPHEFNCILVDQLSPPEHKAYWVIGGDYLTDLQLVHIWDFLQGRITARLATEPEPSDKMNFDNPKIQLLLDRIDCLEQALKRAKNKEKQLRERIQMMRGTRVASGCCVSN